MIKCIIFDCDGTLVDSEHLFNRALSQQLKEHSIELSAEQLVTRFRGVKLTTILDTLTAEFGLRSNDSFIDDYRKSVGLIFSKELVACDGVSETLSQIDLAMCVASNGPLAKTQLALRVTGLARYFDDKLFSAYDVNSWKPEPDLFLHAAKKMGFQPEQCHVLEDSVVGIQAAKAAGMTALLYDPNSAHTNMDGVTRIQHFSELLRSIN